MIWVAKNYVCTIWVRGTNSGTKGDKSHAMSRERTRGRFKLYLRMSTTFSKVFTWNSRGVCGGHPRVAETPRGRAVVTSTDVSAREQVFSVPLTNVLCLADEPGEGESAMGRAALAAWEEAHGSIPGLLREMLLGMPFCSELLTGP
jgi:hypothetical protein